MRLTKMSEDQFKAINGHFNKPDEKDQRIAELENELETLNFNYDLRIKEIAEVIDSHGEDRWTYWRKRAGEILDNWREQCTEIAQLKAKLLEAEKDSKRLDWMIENEAYVYPRFGFYTIWQHVTYCDDKQISDSFKDQRDAIDNAMKESEK
jgi:hypothetical protein